MVLYNPIIHYTNTKDRLSEYVYARMTIHAPMTIHRIHQVHTLSSTYLDG